LNSPPLFGQETGFFKVYFVPIFCPDNPTMGDLHSEDKTAEWFLKNLNKKV